MGRECMQHTTDLHETVHYPSSRRLHLWGRGQPLVSPDPFNSRPSHNGVDYCRPAQARGITQLDATPREWRSEWPAPSPVRDAGCFGKSPSQLSWASSDRLACRETRSDEWGEWVGGVRRR